MNSKPIFLVLACVAWLSGACGEPASSIEVDGSSTVFPINEAVGEEFTQATDGSRVAVSFSGTGGGIAKFCRGEIDIAAASRPIKEEEIEDCAEEGITDIVEIQVAVDALTVVVNPANSFVKCLSISELRSIFSDGGPTLWSGVRDEFPDEPITLYYPGTDSGTFDFFVERVVQELDEETSHTAVGTASEDDNVLGLGVAGDESAIGYFGFAYYQEATADLEAVAIDGGEGCVEPTAETALSGSYPLARPLFIYTDRELLQDEPDLARFIRFYLTAGHELVSEVGYIPPPDDVVARQLAMVEQYLPNSE